SCSGLPNLLLFPTRRSSDLNESIKDSDKFICCGACRRPFEQLQFIRGTVNLYMDLMDPPRKMMEFSEKMHDFYCRQLTKWAQTRSEEHTSELQSRFAIVCRA